MKDNLLDGKKHSPFFDEASGLFRKLNDSRIRRGLDAFTDLEQEKIIKTIQKEIEDKKCTFNKL